MRVCKYDIVIMRKAEYRRALRKKFFRALAMHGGVAVPSKPKKPCASIERRVGVACAVAKWNMGVAH